MSVVQTSQLTLPSDPTVLKQIKDACFEISASMTRAEGEKDFQKNAVADLAKATDIPAKFLKKIASLYHRQNREQVEAEQGSTVELYDRIFDTQPE